MVRTAEAQFHLNPLRGRPRPRLAMRSLKVIDLDERHVEALVHLARIDALRGIRRGRPVARSRTRIRVRRAVGAAGTPRSVARRTPPAGGRSSATAAREHALPRTGRRDVLTGIDPSDTERFAEQFLTKDVPADVAAYGHRLSAYASCGRGQFREALGHLDEVQASDVDSDVEVRSLIVATPGSPSIPRPSQTAPGGER